MTPINVIGHKIPDTDCTLAAIIFADFLGNKGYDATPYIQWKLNKETQHLLKTLGIDQPEIKTSFAEGSKIALVDHNEASQTVDNITELDLEWIVDHHKIDLTTKSPLNIRMESLCSTCSVLYKMYTENNIDISKEIGTLMLAGLLSDSLLFRSATTTKEDMQIAYALREITGIEDFEKFAMPMFDAKSDLGDMSAKDIVMYDYKEFPINDITIGVGTLETTSPSYAMDRKEMLLEAMKEIKSENNLEFIMLSVVDIIGKNNTSLVLDGADSEVLTKVFETEVQDNTADLGNRLSRKKQVMPDLVDYFSQQ